MSVRTGMYHFEVSRTAMYRVRYVLVRTSTYSHVLPCTRCTGFQMDDSDQQDSDGLPGIVLQVALAGLLQHAVRIFLPVSHGLRVRLQHSLLQVQVKISKDSESEHEFTF